MRSARLRRDALLAAGEDGFCYRHSPADAPGSGAAASGAPGDSSTDHATHRPETMANEQTESEIGKIRDEVTDVAEEVVGHPLSGVTSIDRDEDDGWTVAVEVVERSSVPDTQDILGRYELDLDDDRTVTGYRRTHRYRRDDTEQDL